MNVYYAPTHDAGATIDLCFARHSLNASCAIRDDLEVGSDHRTLLTQLSDTGPERDTSGKLRYSACNWVTFRKIISDRLVAAPSSDPEREASFLVDALQGALNATCPRKRTQGPRNRWWTRDCTNAHNALCQAKRSGSVAIAERRAFGKAVKKAKREMWREKVDQVSCLTEAYRVTSWHKKTPCFHTPPLNGPDGLVFTPMAKAQLLQGALLSRHMEHEDIVMGIPTVARRSLPWPALTNQGIFRSCCVVSSSSPGLDEITAEALRQAWPVLGPRVTDLFRLCDLQGLHPNAFKKASIIILPKTGNRNKALPKSYRPIALLSCLGKGLERLMARRLSFLALSQNILANNLSEC